MQKRTISCIRDIVLKIVCGWVIFTFVFSLTHPLPILYLGLLDLLWFALLLSSKRSQNRELFRSCLLVTIGSIFAFALDKHLDGYSLCVPSLEESLLMAIAAVEVMIAFIPVRGRQSHVKSRPLYAERQYDLARLKACIMNMDLVGINAPWGTGKSFVLEHLKNDADITASFEMIQIDLLACDLDKVELILIEELDKVLLKNRIHSRSSSQLKGLLGKNQWGELVWKLLGTDVSGLSASIDNFKKELNKLDKKVLIIFEDIDRIADKATIKNIFAISEKLSCHKLHVVFQYDIHTLNEMGFTREYLEKYIPYDTSLTEIPYDKLVEFHWDETISADCPLAIRDVISLTDSGRQQYRFSQWLGGNFEYSIVLGSQASPRKVKNFLSELNFTILSNPEFQKEQTKRTVVSAIFIKHFFAPYFDSLTIGESPLDTLMLNFGGANRTLPEIMAECARIKSEISECGASEIIGNPIRQLLDDPKNREIMAILFLFDYELEIESSAMNWSERIAESENNLRKKEKNENIDRIIWNVISNGTSELTDNANAIGKLREEVLCKSGADRKIAWENYQRELYEGQLRSGNRTIFKMGADRFWSLSRGMLLSNASQEDWALFLDFYFVQYREEYGQGETPLSRSVVDCLNYCDWNNKSNFLLIIDFYNGLKVVSNFNQEKSYQRFFEKSMQAICHFGYCTSMYFTTFQLPGLVSDNQAFADRLLKALAGDLNKNRNCCSLGFVTDEFDAVIRFVEKNIELINCSSAPPQRGSSISIKEESRWAHQDEIDRLKALEKSLSAEAFRSSLAESYKDGKISLYELRTVWKELFQQSSAQ